MRTKSLIFLTCLTVTSGLMLTACGSKQDEAPKELPSVPVLAVKPNIKDVPVYVESIGTLRPSIFMEIRPQVSGPLTEVLVSEGEWVHEGTPLFKIDPKPYQIGVQEAEAKVAMDRSTLNAAQKKLERFKSLVEKDFVSQLEWDELEAENERALATLEADQAKLNAAKLDLLHCSLLSPLDGRIGKLDAHPGLLVGDGQTTPLVTISKMDPLIVEFTVTEKELPKLPQNSLEIEIQALSSADVNTKGEITFLDNHFDTDSGLLLIRGKVANPAYSLRPGQSVRVRMPVAVNPNTKLIPQKAVKYNAQGPYVYIVQPDETVGFRQVTLGEEHGTDVIILEGIDPGEFVITDGHLRLFPGLKVEIKS